MTARLSEDGFRWYSPCAGGCGVEVVTIDSYIGQGLCVDCGRARYGASNPVLSHVRPDYSLPMGQPGQSWPGRLDPDRLNRPLRKRGRARGALDAGEQRY